MTALHLPVPFEAALPPLETIVTRLNLLTEELVEYDERRWNIVCAALGSEFGLYPGDENQYILTSFDLRPTYLVEATLVVLQALGGRSTAPVSEWASQPWRVAQHYY
jgi:hypothetical protein